VSTSKCYAVACCRCQAVQQSSQ